ncbi:MAG: hypothetical protein K5866_09230 [Treponema sp.]|nr:hypothetical protein [Treponema sp.]
MEKKDLIEFSPVQYFTNAAGQLKDGELGLITAKKGLGKTSVLVQFGLDSLLRDKAIVHVSFDQHSSNVISWYSNILAEISKKKNIDNKTDLADDIARNRTILNFNQETFTLPKVVNTIKALNEGGVKISTIIIDGLDLAKTSKEDLDVLAKFVKKEEMTAWFSYTSEADNLKDTLEADKLDLFTSVAHLAAEGKNLNLNILKNGNGCVKVDTKTLLISK